VVADAPRPTRCEGWLQRPNRVAVRWRRLASVQSLGWRSPHKAQPRDTPGSWLGGPVPACCGNGPGSHRSWGQWLLRGVRQPDSICASASRHKARQAKLAETDHVLARVVGSTGRRRCGSSGRPGVVAGRRSRWPGLPAASADGHPRGTLVAARHGLPARPRQTIRSADGALSLRVQHPQLNPVEVLGKAKL
jgi:hypothetical protein